MDWLIQSCTFSLYPHRFQQASCFGLVVNSKFVTSAILRCIIICRFNAKNTFSTKSSLVLSYRLFEIHPQTVFLPRIVCKIIRLFWHLLSTHFRIITGDTRPERKKLREKMLIGSKIIPIIILFFFYFSPIFRL